jgi:hypothetical protein
MQQKHRHLLLSSAFALCSTVLLLTVVMMYGDVSKSTAFGGMPLEGINPDLIYTTDPPQPIGNGECYVCQVDGSCAVAVSIVDCDAESGEYNSPSECLANCGDDSDGPVVGPPPAPPTVGGPVISPTPLPGPSCALNGESCSDTPCCSGLTCVTGSEGNVCEALSPAAPASPSWWESVWDWIWPW